MQVIEIGLYGSLSDVALEKSPPDEVISQHSFRFSSVNAHVNIIAIRKGSELRTICPSFKAFIVFLQKACCGSISNALVDL